MKTQDKTYDKGRPGLGGRDSTVAYEYVEINGPGIPPTAVEPVDKLAITWGELKKKIDIGAGFCARLQHVVEEKR